MNDQHAVTAHRNPWWRTLSALFLFLMLATFISESQAQSVIIGAGTSTAIR
ncbi:MAG: hypothetical protein IPI95_15135 [Flavobacteriales bacterium]|nr:hypothetical protein [Flavobacteriales bacterium]